MSHPRDAESWYRGWQVATDMGIYIRPRALTLTLFVRVCLGDFFIHGIGGGKRIKEAALAEYDPVPERGKTPPGLVKRMHDDVAKMLTEPETKKKYEVLGIEAASATADQMAVLMKSEIALWTPIIKAANIKGE